MEAARAAIIHPSAGYCPHCRLLAERGATAAPWPPVPVRCPHCRLLIGAGRSLTEPAAQLGARGTAAGVFSRRAKRPRQEGDPERASPAEVLSAIRTVASSLGQRPERLLMVDYQQIAVSDPAIPPLGDVLSAFESWKSARRLAAQAA